MSQRLSSIAYKENGRPNGLFEIQITHEKHLNKSRGLRGDCRAAKADKLASG